MLQLRSILMLAAGAALLTSAPLRADQRTFQAPGQHPKTFFGYVQYCNPVFLQGFVGQVGKTQTLSLRVWVGHHSPRSQQLSWRMVTGAPIEAKLPNAEGEVVLGYRCGFALNFAQMPQADRPLAGDLIWIYIARTGDGGAPQYWRMFERTVGAGGNANANPDKGESQGAAYFQGRIGQIRPDSIRGYALDDLALSGRTGPDVFNPLKVLVLVGARPVDATGEFKHVAEIPCEANEEAELPLYLTDPPGTNAAGTTWKFGFTANLKERLTEGNEYQVTLMEVSLNRLVLDRRTIRISTKKTLPAIASYALTKQDAAGGAQLEFVKDASSKRDAKVLEQMATRAMLSKDEFFKQTPEGEGEGKSGFWKPAGELLYRYEGAGGKVERAALPGPAGTESKLDPLYYKGEGRGLEGATGGFSPDKTRNLWVQLIKDEQDPAARAEKKQYLYEWAYSEPFYETYLYSLYRNVTAKKIEKTYNTLTMPSQPTPTAPDPAPGNVVDLDALPAPAAGSTGSSAATTTVTNDYITIFLNAAGTAPLTWQEIDEAKRKQTIEKHKAKLDDEFNIYKDVQFGVAAFSTQAIARKNSEVAALATSGPASGQTPPAQTSSNPLTDPTTNPSVEDSKIATATFKLKGEHDAAPYDDKNGTNHPLFVSVRYVYDMGVDTLKKGAARP